MPKSLNQPIKTGDRLTGTFEIEGGRRVFGELAVDGKQTLLYLRDDEFFHTHALENGYLQGTAHDLSRLSLIGCITLAGPGTGSRGDESYTFAELFPHYIVHGSTHLRPDEKTIAAISFTIDDGRAAFYDFDAFGSVIDPEPLISKVANANRKVTGRKAPIGPHPHIQYFTGRTDLLEVQTALGRIAVRNRPRMSIAGARPPLLEDSVSLEIGFDGPVDFDTSEISAATLTRFFDLIIGRPQHRHHPSLRRVATSGAAPDYLQVYPTMPDTWERANDQRSPGPRDVLIEGVSNRREMEKVLRKWLALDDERRDARLRFAYGFNHGRKFSEDRLIGAANMFDLLPGSAVPPKVKLPKKVLEAQNQARALFDALEDSPERQSILSALGRIGGSNLARKIGHRANIITKQLPWLAPDMAFVIRQAVLCRNHYVHGSKAGFDYRKGTAISFFTRALEFIFGGSDLIDCGWKIQRFCQSGGGDHPFSELMRMWPMEVADVKQRLAGTPMGASND